MPDGGSNETLMRLAVIEANRGVGLTSPNPAVGAILVRNGEVLARGYHARAGAPHAEVDCLRHVDLSVSRGATLYVTLEPCSTFGKTPPCTDAIIAAGVSEVVIGAIDPNPQHAGRALQILKTAGVGVRSGVLAEECAAINPGFNKWIRTGRPLVIVKCGMTLDGRLTRPPREGQWITSAAARRHANRRRADVDAILVGAETVRADNPHLTVRGIAGARQPWRVVLTRSGRLPRSAHVFTDTHSDRTIVLQNQALERVLDQLGRREITSVLIEGGGDIIGQAVDGGLIDRVELYVGAVLTGGPVVAFSGVGAASTAGALKLIQPRYEAVGGDVFMSAAVESATS